MKRIRINKDIAVTWALTIDGREITASDDISLELRDPFGNKRELTFSVEGNALKSVFLGIDQTTLGEYMLTAWLNKGREGQAVVDNVYAFSLVQFSDQESGSDPDNLETESISLTGQFAVGPRGEKGETGPQGPKGDTGTNDADSITYDSTKQTHTAGSVGAEIAQIAPSNWAI